MPDKVCEPMSMIISNINVTSIYETCLMFMV